MYPRLVNEVHSYSLLKQRLRDAFPDADDDTQRDTLEGITNLHEIIAELIRSALVDQSMAEGLKSRMEDMKTRLDRLAERARKKKQLAQEAMNNAEIRKLRESGFTASLRRAQPSLQILSEPEIPEDFWVPQPPKLDRTGLILALKRGKEIPGASLAPPQPSLAVRTK